MKKQHYHLVSGLVMFRDPTIAPEQGGGIGEFKQNTTLRTASREVPASEIGRAQQTLQMLMFQKLEDPNLQVIDVHINSISYLGLMTEDDFIKPPAGATAADMGVPTPIDSRLQ